MGPVEAGAGVAAKEDAALQNPQDELNDGGGGAHVEGEEEEESGGLHRTSAKQPRAYRGLCLVRWRVSRSPDLSRAVIGFSCLTQGCFLLSQSSYRTLASIFTHPISPAPALALFSPHHYKKVQCSRENHSVQRSINAPGDSWEVRLGSYYAPALPNMRCSFTQWR